MRFFFGRAMGLLPIFGVFPRERVPWRQKPSGPPSGGPSVVIELNVFNLRSLGRKCRTREPCVVSQGFSHKRLIIDKIVEREPGRHSGRPPRESPGTG